jgi:hypothetical protein
MIRYIIRLFSSSSLFNLFFTQLLHLVRRVLTYDSLHVWLLIHIQLWSRLTKKKRNKRNFYYYSFSLTKNISCLIDQLSDCNSILTRRLLIDNTRLILLVVVMIYEFNKIQTAYCYCLKMNRSNKRQWLKMNTIHVQCSLDERMHWLH